jgi:hypothetical protein
MEHYGAEINDKQRIVMDGFQIPLTFCNGLAYLKCHPLTDAKVNLLPHLIMAADVDCDPTSYDNVILDLHKFYYKDIDEVPHETLMLMGTTLHVVQPEPKFFELHEFLAFDKIIHDIVGSLNP